MENITSRQAKEITQRIIANVEKVIVGKHTSVRLAVMALMCQGHALIDGVPGVGKTMLARSIAISVGGAFKRIQCTSDLLPSDIIGAYIFDQKDRDFHFRAGPIMANLVMIDEINRASPRTQSAFLEAMEEKQVTVDGITHETPQPFFLLATRNPIEHGGTFPLPDTELDRFLIRIHLHYPTVEEEVAILEGQLPTHPISGLEHVASVDEIVLAQSAVRNIFVDRLVTDYVVSLVNATRNHPSISLGASPRASLALVALSQANAILEDRDFVLPDDVKSVAEAVLGHRILLTAAGHSEGTENETIQGILDSIPIERRADQGRVTFPSVRPQTT